MFSIEGSNAQLCDRVSRRELLRIGGTSAFGLTLPQLLQARDTALSGVLPTDTTFGKAKNLIYLYLQGGPPQHETFDPKPQAPAEIRGPFRPIHTNVPGIDFCELLPRTARIADKLAVVRSMSTDDNIHSSSGYWVLTGNRYVGPNARTIQATDWPYFGSLVKMLKPSEQLPPLSSVWIPDVMRLNENVTPAGQTGGFLGNQWSPDRFIGDPSQLDYRVQGLNLAELPPLRIEKRADLLSQVERHFRTLERGREIRSYDRYQQQAFDLMTSDKARRAFEIADEPDDVRRRYTMTTWGQCCLLARRLIESGVRMVHVNWPREPGDNAADNPLWDTHAQNHDRVEDVLCPQFDVTFTTLIDDLEQRGLLDETLVVAIGEFGRTPKINAKAGRDHWGHVFSFAMAGAGIRGGQVWGSSDANGAYPAQNRVRPGDLTATIFHLLGIDWRGTFHDREGRERRLTEGEPLAGLLGIPPVQRELRSPGGALERVPVYDPSRLLADVRFQDEQPFGPVTGSSRPKQWRAEPRFEMSDSQPGWGVRRLANRARIGFRGNAAWKVGEVALLAQEVRSPFSGQYRISMAVRGNSNRLKDAQAFWEQAFQCRLEFFEFTDPSKSPLHRKTLAQKIFPVQFGEDSGFVEVQLEKLFINPKPGSNFSFGLGLGVAVIVERQPTDAVSNWPLADFAEIEIESVELTFDGKKRNEKVKV